MACTHQHKKNTLIAPHSYTRKKCTHHKKKEKCTLQHQYARTWCCCACVCACVRARACLYICAACAHHHKIYTNQHHTHIPEKKNALTTKKKRNAHTSTIMHAPCGGVRVCMSAAQLVTLVACVCGSLSYSALRGRCVLCVHVSGIYSLGGGIKVSGGGGSVRACVLVVAIVCACMCVCARAWW